MTVLLIHFVHWCNWWSYNATWLKISTSKLAKCPECPPTEQSHGSTRRNHWTTMISSETSFSFLDTVTPPPPHRALSEMRSLLLCKKKKKVTFCILYFHSVLKYVCWYLLTVKIDTFVVESCITSDETLSSGATWEMLFQNKFFFCFVFFCLVTKCYEKGILAQATAAKIKQFIFGYLFTIHRSKEFRF